MTKRWQTLGRAQPAAGDEYRDLDLDGYINLLESSSLLNTTWGSLNDEELVTTFAGAYRANGPVFALVLARLQVFSQARFQWAQFDKGRPGEPFGTNELSILERPWPGGTTADLLARMEVHASTAGNAFIRRRANRLHMLRPEWTTIILGSQEDADHPDEASDAVVIGYAYKPGGRDRMQVFMPNEIAHYAPIPDPAGQYVGMSWISPVLTEVRADDLSVIHKRKFFENAATPNLAIKFDPVIKIEQVREFKALLEAEHRGAWNAYKTLYLGGGADPLVIGKDFKELDFSATQGKGESRLASAAGVPPSWVGFSEGLQGSALNAGNFAAARRRFGDGTMRHLWTNAAATLETIVRPPAGASVHLTYDPRDIPFLREDSSDVAQIQQQEATTIAALVRDGFTPESVIEAVQNQDWSLLEHSGLLSVQLHPTDGTSPTPTAPAVPAEGQNPS